MLGLETCRDGADRPCYGRLIREVDRQRGFQEEELHDRLVREHLRGYNRTEKRQLRKNLCIPEDKPLLTHNPRTHIAGPDHEMGTLAWDDVFRSRPMWSQEAERKANKFKPEHKTRFIVSNAPELGGQIHPLTQKHVQLINVIILLKTLDKLTEDPNQQTITSCVGVVDGYNYSNSVNVYCVVPIGSDFFTVNSVTNFNRGGVRRAVKRKQGEVEEVYQGGVFVGLANLPYVMPKFFQDYGTGPDFHLVFRA